MTNVVCAIIEKASKFLVVQRSEVMSMPLKWEFPRGKIEKGESSKQAIVREVFEELNIDINIVKELSYVIHAYDSIEIKLIPFCCGFKNGEIKLLEHKSLKWISKKDLKNLNWCEADIPIVNEFLSLGGE